MGDLDNAPMPPIGPDGNMGMNDPMGGEDPSMGAEPPMGGPEDMGGQDPSMGGGDDDELMNIVNGMSTEDKAAVIKYAKSMVDDSASGDDGGMMPESKFSFSRIIDETLGSLLDKKKDNGIERPGKKLNSKQRGNKSNPFVSPY